MRNPFVLSSENGILDVTLNAHQDRNPIEHSARPVANALVYGYRVTTGPSSGVGTASTSLGADLLATVKQGEKWSLMRN